MKRKHNRSDSCVDRKAFMIRKVFMITANVASPRIRHDIFKSYFPRRNKYTD